MADRPRTYLALLLVLETAMLGVFVIRLDLFLFYVFWEAVLVPAYFLIGSFGGQRRVYAAVKFFVYTLGGRPAHAGRHHRPVLAAPEGHRRP